jgi:hypothetical protein
MASASRRGLPWRRRRLNEAAGRIAQRTLTVGSAGRSSTWSLTSSAARIDPQDSQEAKVQRMLRQGWQSDAWMYRDSIGEVRFASNFLANVTSRMRLYPACYGIGGESDKPEEISKVQGAPPELASVCAEAMQDLGNGREAISGMLHTISSNKGIAGEWYLLGRADQQTGIVRWSARSVDELVVYDGNWHLREIPDDRQNGIIPWIDLSKDATPPVISRVWTPHPRFQLMADSPMRAMLDDCESLMILRRMIRAAGRSRLAGAGALAIPEEFSIKGPVDDDEDPDADPFFSQLERAMVSPISDEGVASAAADSQVAVAGLVTHRQRPATARGVVFISLEDETGLVNVICPPHVWERHRKLATVAPALLIHGRVERTGGAVNLVAVALRPLRVTATVPSRDFR